MTSLLNGPASFLTTLMKPQYFSWAKSFLTSDACNHFPAESEVLSFSIPDKCPSPQEPLIILLQETVIFLPFPNVTTSMIAWWIQMLE